MLEKEIEKRIAEYAKSKKILNYKFVSPNNRGVPDRIFISPHKGIFFIEFKRKDKQPTQLQQYSINQLMEYNCKVYIIDNTFDGIKIIDEYATLTT